MSKKILHLPVNKPPEIPKPEPISVQKTRRLLNRWSIFGLLFVSSVVIVLFVSNALAVNKLLFELDSLQKEHEKILHQNELLRQQIVQLQAADRITDIAHTKLGMIQAPTAPKKLRK